MHKKESHITIPSREVLLTEQFYKSWLIGDFLKGNDPKVSRIHRIIALNVVLMQKIANTNNEELIFPLTNFSN